MEGGPLRRLLQNCSWVRALPARLQCWVQRVRVERKVEDTGISLRGKEGANTNPTGRPAQGLWQEAVTCKTKVSALQKTRGRVGMGEQLGGWGGSPALLLWHSCTSAQMSTPGKKELFPQKQANK